MEAPPLERKLVAVLAADVEGYSRAMHLDEEATLRVLSSHRKIIDGLIAIRRGRVTGTAGDSVLAEFSSVIDAVHCAVAIQQALVVANDALPEERRLLIRIGINVGDVMLKDGDIFGDGVNIAARLEGLSTPGGICVTRGVRDHLRDHSSYGFEDMGEQSVKNIARPIRVYRVLFHREADPPPPDADVPRVLAEAPKDAVAEPPEFELAFWDAAEKSGQAEDFEAYLERYPEGAFAALAQSRLEKPAIETGDHSVELAFWDSVKDSTNPDMIRAYLEKFPAGEFRSLAEIQLAELDGTVAGRV